ncbi:RNA polymerase sigma factor [Clostridium sp. KNHs214]|uniref:RNA polymerase sigma factor n=1 Tax=Clostridium sp. KNHs214 TaxID=1540257 RepID=UPI0005594A78|nr:RNA polymerase sigma factor [Clostridium sp. KNHs214]
MDYVSDEDLFKKVKNGNKEAMEFIVRRYYKNIFRYIYIKIKDYHTSQDICQEVFCKVYEKRKSYLEEYLFKPWLYKIAYNSVVDYTRSKIYKNRNSITYLHEDIKEKDNVIEYKIINNNIDDLIEDLNEIQKEVLKFRFCESMSIEDIALITGSSLNTTKSRLYQGIKHIKSKLQSVRGGDSYEERVK